MRYFKTVILAVTCGVIAGLATYGAFTLGFYAYASKLPQYDGKTAIYTASVLHVNTNATTNANQAYSDSGYYLQPAITPMGR